MSKRYYGREEVTSHSQVVRYLQENWVDGNGEPIPEDTAMKLVIDNEKMIKDAINVFRSMVYYCGDQIGAAQIGWTELEEDPDDDPDYEDEDDDE